MLPCALGARYSGVMIEGTLQINDRLSVFLRTWAPAGKPLAPPGPGEARIAIRAVVLNFADVFACLGLYSATPAGSCVPGLEAAGVVEALGPPVAGRPTPAVGDRVIVLTRFGGYATALNVDTRYLAPVPGGWSFEAAAAFPVQALTAWYGLVRLGASTDAGEMTGRFPPEAGLAAGQNLEVSLALDRFHLFDPDKGVAIRGADW